MASLPRRVSSGSVERKKRLLLTASVVALMGAAALRAPMEWKAWQERSLRSQDAKSLERLVSREPKNVNAKYFLAMAYVKEGRIDEAPRLFREALVLDPVRADILNDLGATYLVQRRYYESLIALQGAVSAQPGFAPAWANLGRLHIAMEMPYTAVKELRKAVGLDAAKADVLADLGEACRRTLNYKGAEDAYAGALKIQGDHVRSHTGLALVKQEKGDIDGAIQILEDVERRWPGDSGVLATLGGLYLKKEADPDLLAKAEGFLRMALEKEPELLDAWMGLGNLALIRDKPKDAVEPLTRAITVAPEHMGALNLLERALRRSGRVAEADRAAKVIRKRALREREETVMEERTSRNAEDWDAVARLAELYLESNRTYKAIWMTNRLKEGAPDHPKLPRLLQAVGPSASPAMPAPAGGL